MSLKIFIRKFDDYLNYQSFLSKTGFLLIFLGVFLTTISFWLGIHVLMFIPAFVISLFIYSFIDVYLASKKFTIFWQKIYGKLHLNINWKKKVDYSFFKLFYKEKNKIICTEIAKDLSLKIPSDQYNLFLLVQGRLDIFRKIISIPRRIQVDAKEQSKYEIPILQDTYIHIRPYKEGDNLSRIDPLQTVKRDQIYIRELISDIIRKPKRKKLNFDIKFFLKSNLSLKKRDDLKKGITLEWFLIFIGILASFLEWENLFFLIISVASTALIYYTNSILKMKLFTRKQMNFWMILVFLIFIGESVITKDIIESGIHFLILVCVLKHRFERERRDAFTYIFLILFVFVALSFFTLKIWFMLFFIMYLITAIGLFAVYAGGERKEEYELDFGRPKSKMSYLMMNTTILVLTISLFFILPHGTKLQASSSRYLPKGPEIAKTGFSDEVSLNMILSIKKDYSKQFILENVDKEKLSFYEGLYWTGMRFNYFDNLRWIKEQSADIDYFPLPIKSPKKEKWTLQYYPNDNQTVFIPIIPLNISGAKFKQAGNDRSLIKFSQKILKATNIEMEFYKNESTNEIMNIPAYYREKPPEISNSTNILFERFWKSIPANIQKNPEDIARFIRDKSGFSYSLDAPAKDLESFLYKEKKGHCEYFATVLALTLQHFGFQATMVNGFHGGEYQELTNSWVIRGEHAHSWVELMQKDGAWLILDATPSSQASSFWFKDVQVLQTIITYYDYIEYKWFEYIVQFDVSRQKNLWKYFAGIIPYLVLLIIIIFGLYRSYLLLQNTIIPYYKLEPKYKFMHWLSKKTNHDSLVLGSFERNFPILTSKTREIIYGHEPVSPSTLHELKMLWNKALKNKA